MDFWQEFNQHCLQSPWFINPQGTGIEALDPIPSGRAFVYPSQPSDSVFAMMGKMVAALKLDAGQVNFLEQDINLLGDLEELESKKIVFFGGDFPGTFGEAFHWSGHQVIKTHALEDLENQPELKKETWEHLKLFARLP